MVLRTNRGILAFVALAAWGELLDAQSITTQTLTLEVKPISKISVSGNPNSLLITDFTAGTNTATVSDNSTWYDITTNLNGMKIVASISDPMPDGTRLMLKLGSSKGSSAGTVDISDARTPLDVVQAIERGMEASQTISYVFAADATAGEIVPQSRTITLTLTE